MSILVVKTITVVQSINYILIDRFFCLFIAPRAIRRSYKPNIRHLIVIDAMYTTSSTYSFFSTISLLIVLKNTNRCHLNIGFRMNLMLACVLDGNQQVLLLAWALVDSENYDN